VNPDEAVTNARVALSGERHPLDVAPRHVPDAASLYAIFGTGDMA
jgi:hypothetical protein